MSVRRVHPRVELEARGAAFDERRGTVRIPAGNGAVGDAMRRLQANPSIHAMLADDAYAAEELEDGARVLRRPDEPPEMGALRVELAQLRADLAATKRSLVIHDGAGVVALRVGSRGLFFALRWAVGAWFRAMRLRWRAARGHLEEDDEEEVTGP